MYLTGINEPDLVLVIDTDKEEATLVLPSRNDYQNLWDGEIDLENIKKVSGIEKFIEELSQYKGGKGSVQFPLDEPIPYDLIRRITLFRVEENLSLAKNKPKK